MIHSRRRLATRPDPGGLGRRARSGKCPANGRKSFKIREEDHDESGDISTAGGAHDGPPGAAQGRRRQRRPGARLGRRARGAQPPGAGARRPARRDPEDPRGRHGLAHRRRLAEGRRDVPRRHQGHGAGRRAPGRRAHLHGAQQPEPAQLPLPRLPEALGDLHRRQHQLDRPRPGRLQRPPAAGDRHRHRRFRRHRDGRALRGRRLRQGARLGDARLGGRAHRHARLRELPAGPGRHLGRQDLPHLHRRRLPHLRLPHRRLLRPHPRRGLEGRRQRRRVGRARHLAAGAGGDQVPQGQDRPLRRPGLRLSRPAQGLGRLRLLLPGEPRHRLRQAPRRPGLALRPRHHEAAGQQPRLRARDPGRARRPRHPAARPDQRRPQHHRLPAVPRRHRRGALLVGRCRARTPAPPTAR